MTARPGVAGGVSTRGLVHDASDIFARISQRLPWDAVTRTLVRLIHLWGKWGPRCLKTYLVPRRGLGTSSGGENIDMFGFHGRKNAPLSLIEPGDFSEDIKIPQDGKFIYSNPDLQLQVGDVIYYWIYLQHLQFGYRRDGQQWKVTELKNQPSLACETSETRISNRLQVCSNSTVFEDTFDGEALDRSKWIMEHYIPEEPDYEFVIYKDDSITTYLKKNHLFVSPKLQTEDGINENITELLPGCTREPNGTQCRRVKYYIQNPVLSGRIVSKHSFSYGDIEVRAKLPLGDWIYPEIYLEGEKNTRIIIAYARGNEKLTGTDNEDIGNSLLFGGPMLSHREPERSSKLRSFRLVKGLFSDDFHVYRLRWSKDVMELYVDGERYGDIPAGSIGYPFTENANRVRLVLGVGVGGVSDFPNNYKSGNTLKPWENGEQRQVSKFYAHKTEWLPTWTDATLTVDYVKITAL